MVWNQIVDIRTPPIVTTDFLYLRFIGARSLHEKYFGRLQKNRTPEMQKCLNRIKRTEQNDDEEENKCLRLTIVAANNHYTGFGPIFGNIFGQMMGLKSGTWHRKAKGTIRT
jgi:hypothetical protein